MKYYIVVDGKPAGPFDIAQLAEQGIKGKDLVWKEGLSEWVAAETIDELQAVLYGAQQTTSTPPSINTDSETVPPTPPVPPISQPSNTQFTYQPSQPMGFPPKNWLVESILVTLFCCLPFGIIGIIKASTVSSLWASGRVEESQKASSEAKKWTLIGFWIGMAQIFAVIIFYALIFTGLIASQI